MAVARPILGFASIILILGALLLMLLTLIGGSVGHNPINKFYFLEADTSQIPGAAPLTRWTFWNACTVINGRDDCPKVHPAYPFDPPRNFGTSSGVPQQFIGTHKYYYLTRFMFAFILIALFFTACALFLGLLALCSRIGSFLSSFTCSVALFFQALAASLMTAAYVLGRRNFRSAGRSASLGRYNFGFMWAAVACLFLATVMFCVGGAASGSRGTYTKRTGGRSFMGRRKKSTRSRRSRGSFIDTEGQRKMRQYSPDD